MALAAPGRAGHAGVGHRWFALCSSLQRPRNAGILGSVLIMRTALLGHYRILTPWSGRGWSSGAAEKQPYMGWPRAHERSQRTLAGSYAVTRFANSLETLGKRLTDPARSMGDGAALNSECRFMSYSLAFQRITFRAVWTYTPNVGRWLRSSDALQEAHSVGILLREGVWVGCGVQKCWQPF